MYWNTLTLSLDKKREKKKKKDTLGFTRLGLDEGEILVLLDTQRERTWEKMLAYKPPLQKPGVCLIKMYPRVDARETVLGSRRQTTCLIVDIYRQLMAT